ncbi:MmgE/PrpD family protein [Pigmentiphaga soli]|uniref:MmgE/PrpD family protein n=1 Tax=Pigmentiphaga soli TaxID=1007095 RepID=A0ABP8GLY9_9BURK
MEGLTRQAGAFAVSLRYEDLPPACIEAARIGTADCVGVMLAGAAEPGPGIVASMVSDSSRADAAPLLPSGRRVAASDAALINGVAAHVLDYDDVALSAHPSAVLVPAILAEGWAQQSSGRDLLTAYVAGYEVWALLYRLEPGAVHDLGFHPTPLVGTIAAAAACARLLRLDAARAATALAISSSLASGLVANFGSMTKSLHAGRAAQSGLLAARLAQAGYTASPDALEHRSGFMQAHSPSRTPDVADRDFGLGAEWRMPALGVCVKRYPICYATHRSIDALLDLAEAHAIAPGDVEAVHVHIGETQMLMLRNHFPQTGLEAKFSLEFAMAAALVARRVGLAELSDDFVRRDDVRDLMRRVRYTTTAEVAQGWDQPYAPADQVTVTLKSGRELRADPVARPKGSWERPLSAAELRAKFLDCAARCLGRPAAAALFDQLWKLEATSSARDLKMSA